MADSPKNNKTEASSPDGPNGPEKKEKDQQENNNESISESTKGGLTSPEGILMLMLAMMLDALGIVLNILFDLNIISDILGVGIIGCWMFIRTGSLSSFKKGKNGESEAEKAIKRIVKKVGFTFAIKIIPFVGSLFSFWTYRVYKELKS